MRRLLVSTLVVALVAVAGLVRADNPTGTWKWTMKMGERTMERTLKLKLEGDKLTGCMIGRDKKETPIQEASFKSDEISFCYVRERNGQKSTTKYTGKLSGDTIKGKIESERDGQKQSRDWEAKRAKD